MKSTKLHYGEKVLQCDFLGVKRENKKNHPSAAEKRMAVTITTYQDKKKKIPSPLMRVNVEAFLF